MRVLPCHPLLGPRPILWRHPFLVRRIIACEPCVRPLIADVPLRTYDQNLHLQNAQRVGTDPPVATNNIPFDLRLSTLNAQLRAAKSDAQRDAQLLTAEDEKPYTQRATTLDQYA